MAAPYAGTFSPATVESLRAAMASFCAERSWQRFHTPRNLALALVGEVGELCEIMQWRGDAGAAPGLPGWSAAEHEHLGEELSDVLLYLVRLADLCGVDLPAAAARKMVKNALKYPAAQCAGKSDKYTAYVAAAAAPSGAPSGAPSNAPSGAAAATAGGAGAPSAAQSGWVGEAAAAAAATAPAMLLSLALGFAAAAVIFRSRR